MNRPDEQLHLALAPAPRRVDVPLEMIWTRPSQGAAFTLACDASGLDDKEIYLALNIDAGTFSRLKKGTNTISGDQLQAFCEVVGNLVYPTWLAYRVGCGLHMLKTEAEKRAEEAEQRAALAEQKLAWAMEVISSRKPG